MRRRVRLGDEHGLATVWVLAGCLLLLAAAAAALTLAQVVVLRHHLSSAADNAALAAAARTFNDGDGCRTAVRVAAAHRVRLDHCEIEAHGSAVAVQVSATAPGLVARVVPRMVAQARAGPA